MGGFGLASWMYYWLDGKKVAAVTRSFGTIIG
jgi:hypothetical protein